MEEEVVQSSNDPNNGGRPKIYRYLIIGTILIIVLVVGLFFIKVVLLKDSIQNSTNLNQSNNMGIVQNQSNDKGIVQNQDDVQENICIENWTCTDWGHCIRENITRSCTDINLCNTYENKPIESKGCSDLCSETDGGKNYLEKGTAKSTQINFEGTAQDYCGGSGPGILREFYCNESYGTYFDDNFDCSSIGKYCFDGACRDADIVCCQISGNNYKLLKFPEYNFCSQLSGVEVDLSECSSSNSYCFDLDDSTERRAQSGDHSTDFIKSYTIRDLMVTEDFCHNEVAYYKTPLGEAACDTPWNYWSVTCENGCLNGACLEGCWTCSIWTSCENGLQTRTCTDKNGCGASIEKPAINQKCVGGNYQWKKFIPTNRDTDCNTLCNASSQCEGDGNDDTKYCKKTLTTFGYPGGLYFDDCLSGTVNEKDFDNFYCCCSD